MASANHLATPPPTPPAPRKTSDPTVITAATPPIAPPCTPPSPPPPRSPRRRTAKLPFEIWAQVFAHLAAASTTPATLVPLLTVCRAWHAEAERLLYRSITFTSLAQRSRFAADRLCCSPAHRTLATEMRWCEKSHKDDALTEAFVVTDAELNNAKRITALVRELDFGFRPPAALSRPVLPAATAAAVSPVAPTPTPQSSSPSTPASSPPTTPIIAPSTTTTPNSIALQHHQQQQQLLPHQRPDQKSSASSSVPYGAWQNRTISPLLVLVAARMPNLTSLCLAGCQFDDGVFADALATMTSLVVLDLAASNVRRHGLTAVATSATKLVRLDLSGIFRFRRIPARHLTEIATACRALTTLIVHDCPDLSADTRAEAQSANPRLAIRWSGFDFESAEFAAAATTAAAAAANAAIEDAIAAAADPV
ncbi:hypothetical protein HDU87_005307 [Geranomyces variabilis]|uniref:F-box domain-containing protein n=1 Tax=Geranomyces variabilis TaxID=109894 RepID=A0AAD5THN0_9FUNG|nr:hypothetical protein HDU87_005307 [Geranomyces variabilis]